MTDIFTSEEQFTRTQIPNLLNYQQGTDVAAPPDGFEQVTNPLNPLLRSGSRFAHFTDGVYDLSAESHLTRLLKVLLGESGVGGFQRQMLLVRLQQALSSTHFFDLDAFYGAVFGSRRNASEILPADPYVELMPASEWDEIRIRDAHYRSRVSRLSSAIHEGATIAGLEALAEALTGVEFESTESWQFGSYKAHTHEDWEALTHTQMEAYTWSELESTETATSERLRNVVTLYPKAPLSEGERFDLERALDRIKPANVIVLVSDELVDIETESLPFQAFSPSEKWEVRQLVQNTRINGILPYPDHEEDAFIEPPQRPFSGYTGEAWTALEKSPRALAYMVNGPVSINDRLDPAAANMPSQALFGIEGAPQLVSMPEFALKPVQGLYSGRAVSDGIVMHNPFADRSGDQTGLFVDKVPADYVAEHLTSSSKLGQRFWTTPVREPGSDYREILEVRFDEPVNINHITFEYAMFPCTIQAQIWNRGTSEWVTVSETVNLQSLPYGIGNTPPPDAPHPYHYGANHWSKVNVSLTPVSSRYFRFVLVRGEGEGPVGISGERIAYPLGLRNIDIGYRINSVSKIPHVPATSPLASTSNILGLQSRYYLERSRAANVADSLPATAWISEPQPVPDAVVNLYLSVGHEGVPSVINQLFLDPVYPGTVANLYYTSSYPIGNAQGEPADDVVVPTEVVGSAIPIPGPGGGLKMGVSDPSAVYIDGQQLGGDSLGGEWWIGLEWEPLTTNVDGYQTHPVFSSSMSDTPVFISHGITYDALGEHYVVFAQANGRVARVAFEESVIPAPNQIVRAMLRVRGGKPELTVSVNGLVRSSQAFDPAVSAVEPVFETDIQSGFYASFDPSRAASPEGRRMQAIRAMPLYLSALDYEGGLTWLNRGSGGTQYAGEIGLNRPIRLREPAIRLPGIEHNYIEVADFGDAHIVGDISVIVRVALAGWNALDRYGDPQVLVSEWYTDVGLNEVSWRLLCDEGFLVWESSPDGTEGNAVAYQSTSPVEFEDGEFFYVAVTHDVDDGGTDNVVYFWYSTDKLTWSPLGDPVVESGTHTRFDGDDTGPCPIRIGATGDTGGENGLAEGLFTELIVCDNIGADGIPGDNVVLEITPDDFQGLDWSTSPVEFEATSGQTVFLARDWISIPGDGDAQDVTKLLVRDAFVAASEIEIDGSETLNVIITSASQHKSLNLIWNGVIENDPSDTDIHPVVTKKFSDASDRGGWGIYIEDDKLILLLSDGNTQADLVLTHPDGAGGIIGRECTISVSTDGEGDITFLAAFRGDLSALTDTISAEDVPGGNLYSSQPIRIFGDGDGNISYGSVSILAYNPTPMVSMDSGTYLGLATGEDVASIGSAWYVTADGVFQDHDLRVGDTLFIVPSGVTPVYGWSDQEMATAPYMVVPVGHAVFGSSVQRGSDIKLTKAALGYGVAPSQFISNPTPYSLIPVSNVHSAYGTFLRFHPEYIGWNDGPTPSIGFMGGAPDAWASAVWTPVGQFVVSRGVVSFDDISAVALKLEFTGLVAEPYETFLPINRPVARFATTPPEVQGRSRDQVSQATISLLTPNRFSDSVNAVFFDQDTTVNYVSPTSGIVVIDGTQRDQIGEQFGFGYTMSSWQPKYRAPIQSVAGQHQYNITQVQALTRTAFFCGIRTIEVRRSVVRGQSDIKVYNDSFLDAVNIDRPLTTLEVEPGQLYTPASSASSLMAYPRSATSLPYYSRRPVTAIQFATQQTGPAQVLPDDEFRSPSLVSYHFDAENQWHRSGDAIAFWDPNFGTVRISRDPSILDAFYAPDSPIVHPPVSPVLSSGFARTLVIDQAAFGGISSPTVRVSPEGVLYAGARVSAYKPLQADLWLRIYGADGVTLLAERSFRPQVDVPTECILPYVLGNFPVVTDGVQVRVEQDGPYMDSWIMHSLSAFDTSILWEFSVDDGGTWMPGHTVKGLRYGVVDFPRPGAALRWRVTCYRYNAVIDAIRIRPWYQHRMGAAL